ncbi:hypothetical protein FHS18_002261 [Paenibacillus phyllosphaerae]|uniref:Copper amine oxidase-like N-terminal domain-containing protein n=1 Tax=Paenibacillus phyllosphaerae TaxID=274593 RepID=A0A7W5AWP2_9BACL|nr:copper amine oxidase N-terminal domain-containing protein [Paenibacillus phyllosphaerae]MBB3110194.1 hypothetical protein [Paenibacillus phyllosphaerae]
MTRLHSGKKQSALLAAILAAVVGFTPTAEAASTTAQVAAQIKADYEQTNAKVKSDYEQFEAKAKSDYTQFEALLEADYRELKATIETDYRALQDQYGSNETDAYYGELYRSGLAMDLYYGEVYRSGHELDQYYGEVYRSGFPLDQYYGQVYRSGLAMDNYYGEVYRNGRTLDQYQDNGGSATAVKSKFTTIKATALTQIKSARTKAEASLLNKRTLALKVACAQKKATIKSISATRAELTGEGLALPSFGIDSVCAAYQPIALIVDGHEVALTQAPVVIDNTVYAPIKGVFTSIGGDVVWDSETKTAVATLGAQKATLKLGSTNAELDGKTVALTAPPRALNGSTMVPVRVLKEVFALSIVWDAKQRAVLVTTGDQA